MDISSRFEEKNVLGNLNIDLNLDIDELQNIDEENIRLDMDLLNDNVLELNSEIDEYKKNNKDNKMTNETNLIKNIFDFQDEYYEENLVFQDLRTQKMSEAEYLEYINCRIQGFLTRGKKLFLNYLQNIITSANLFKSQNNKIYKNNLINSNNKMRNCNRNIVTNINYSINNINDEDLIENEKVENNFYNNYNNNTSAKLYSNEFGSNYKYMQDNSFNVPFELKDQGNLELICFILKEIMSKIIKNAIKNKNHEKKLILLRYPLNVEDIDNFGMEELDKLEHFLSDYSISIYLMKEFKKKKFCKLNNKNVKIKKIKNNFYVIIKKYIFLYDEEAEYFRKNRKNMEEKVNNQFKFLMTEFIKLNNINKKRKNSLNIKNKSKTKKINNFNKNGNDQSIQLEEERNLLKEMNKKYLLKYLNIKHYYEFYLLKDIIREVDNENFAINFIKLKNITKRYYGKKFENWINMEDIDRLFIKNELNNILSIEDKDNEIL